MRSHLHFVDEKSRQLAYPSYERSVGSEEHSEEAIGAIVLDGGTVGPVEDLGEHDGLDENLDHGEEAPDGHPDEDRHVGVVQIVQLDDVIRLCDDRSVDVFDEEHPEDPPHELAVEEAHENPAHEDREVTADVGREPRAARNPGVGVEQIVGDNAAGAQDQAVHAVPAHSLAVVLVSDEVAHLLVRVAHFLFLFGEYS